MKTQARKTALTITDITNTKSVANAGTDAAKLLTMLETANYPEFVSGDGFVRWKHRNLTAESFLAIGSMPSKFTNRIRKTYEQTVNSARSESAQKTLQEAQAEQDASDQMTADEFMDVLKAIIINTAISPKFHEGPSDATKNILDVEVVRNYWQQYYLYIMGNMANGGRQIQAGEGAVTADMLERFLDKERQPKLPTGGTDSEVLGEKSFRIVETEPAN